VKRTIGPVEIWRIGTKKRKSVNELQVKRQAAVSAVGFYDFFHLLAFL